MNAVGANERALSLFRQQLGEDHSHSLALAHNLGVALKAVTSSPKQKVFMKLVGFGEGIQTKKNDSQALRRAVVWGVTGRLLEID